MLIVLVTALVLVAPGLIAELIAGSKSPGRGRGEGGFYFRRRPAVETDRPKRENVG